jgi:hypothetical protein
VKIRSYDGSAAKRGVRCQCGKSQIALKIACLVVPLRLERGYPATNYGASPANNQKTLRRQFGRFYDVKKVRNN